VQNPVEKREPDQPLMKPNEANPNTAESMVKPENHTNRSKKAIEIDVGHLPVHLQRCGIIYGNNIQRRDVQLDSITGMLGFTPRQQV
jgi:hypothetical protein